MDKIAQILNFTIVYKLVDDDKVKGEDIRKGTP